MYNHDVFLFQVDSVQACSIPIQYFGDGAGDCVNESAFEATIPWTSGTQPGSEYGLASSLLSSYNLCLDFMVILDTKQAPVPTTRILRYKKNNFRIQ
jgi:hypothetical protein